MTNPINFVYVVTMSDPYTDNLMSVHSSREGADEWILQQNSHDTDKWAVHEMILSTSRLNERELKHELLAEFVDLPDNYG